MRSIRKPTARRRRSNSAAPIRCGPACSKAFWSPIRRWNRWWRGPYEAGLRGNAPIAGGRLEWKLAVFRTDSINDIIQVASAIPGRGVFQNVDATRRQGLEASAEIKSGPWSALFTYSYHRRDLSVHRHHRLAEQPLGRRRRQYLHHAWQDHSRHSPAPVQGARRLRGDARMDVGGNVVAGRQPVLHRRRRQSERQAAGLLGREPAHELSGRRRSCSCSGS